MTFSPETNTDSFTLTGNDHAGVLEVTTGASVTPDGSFGVLSSGFSTPAFSNNIMPVPLFIFPLDTATEDVTSSNTTGSGLSGVRIFANSNVAASTTYKWSYKAASSVYGF